jgi:hypothetical protein
MQARPGWLANRWPKSSARGAVSRVYDCRRSQRTRAITITPVVSLYARFGFSHKPKSGTHCLLCNEHHRNWHTRPSPRLHARDVTAHDVADPPLEPTRSIRGQVDESGRAASSPAHHLESQGYPGAPNQTKDTGHKCDDEG